MLTDSTNLELSKLDEWTQANKLTLHAGKTKFLVVSNKRVDPENLSLRIMNSIIPPISCCKYLGIYLDDKFTFKDHINYVNMKISRYTGILHKIRDNLPIKARLDYY